MKLHAIELEGFGVLSDLALTDLDPGLNVVYGSNGSGKTTLLQFVRGVLCGFDEGRRVGLLPPADGGVGGGSLRVHWDGDVCRLSRRDEPGLVDRLRVMLVRSDLETPHPRLEARDLPVDLLPLLYCIGSADAHAVDGLIRRARQDGIQLIGRAPSPGRLNRAAAHIHDERFALLHQTQKGEGGLLAELTARRQQLQAERDRLTAELQERCRQWESARSRRPQGDVLQWHRKMTWLRQELAAAECDLREAEDRRWMPQLPPPTITVEPAATRQPARPQTAIDHSRLDRQRIYRLRQLDRRIDHTRTLLAEAARARLDVALRSARIAGSDDTAPGPFLQQIRDSLKSLEVGILELRDDAGQLSARQSPDRCVCDQWQSTTQEAVSELSRRLYRLCEQVSRYELRHQKSLLAGAEETIRASEVELLKHLESLRAQRLTLLGSGGVALAWTGHAQATLEEQNCECLEHEPRRDWRVTSAQPASAAPQQRVVRTIHHVIERPSDEQLSRLRARVEELRRELAAAVDGWRRARHWDPQPALPADIVELERRIDRTRMELDIVGSRLDAAQQRWRVLSVTAEAMRRAVETMQQQQRPTVMQWACGYLQQLTGGRHVEIVVDEDGSLEVIAADGTARSPQQLSRGTRDQLALCLRLALVRAYKARGVSFPLILDDVLVDTDQPRLQAAVTLLLQFAREHSQQIVYLTCQMHLAELFAQQEVSVRTLPGSAELAPRIVAGRDDSFETLRGWVALRQGSGERQARSLTVVPAVSEPAAPAIAPRLRRSRQPRSIRLLKPLQRRQPDGPFWLSIDAPVSLIPSVGSQMGRRLAGLGVRSVGDLIDLDTSEVSLRLASLQITPERLHQWRSEAALLCCVPDLTGPDAQWLSRVGIESVDQLADSRVEELLTALAGLSDGRSADAVGMVPGRQVVQRWIHSARRARRLSDARRLSRSRRLRKSRSGAGDGRVGGLGAARAVSAHAGEPPVRRRQRLTGRRIRRAAGGPNRDATTSARPARQHHSSVAPIVPLRAHAEHHNPQQWRFYLSLESPVVDAPSIGPTTANRLSRIGVITVADLLNRPAAEIALRLKNRRIKDETVRLWQQQSRLMCRIPLLRGHDAQVLVACDITEPEQVAAMTPQALIAIVEPFVNTIEGQRLLRSSRTPDLEEVTDWIHWARHSRTLRAA